MDWVVRLATELRANGVDAILDKWHLREGQDAHAFMEQMVTNPDVGKVVLISDRKYAERSDQRVGGVGAESQIMSGELYGKVDQTKFVAVCRENDENGRAILPVFMKTRIYIDFSDNDQYAERFEQLLRWCFDKPLYIEPELGTAPAFSDNQIAPIVRRQTEFQRSNKANNGGVSRPSAVASFFRAISDDDALPVIERVEGQSEDDNIYESILAIAPLITRVMGVFEEAIKEELTSQAAADELHRYLEVIVSKYERGSTTWSGDVLKFYGQFILVAAIAVMIDNSRGKLANEFLSTPFVVDEYGGMTAKGVSYSRFGAHLKSMEYRNDRLKLRRLSLHSDLIKTVCEAAGFSFRNFIQAELVLYLRSILQNDRWWPDSLLYVSDAHGALPWFVRAVSVRHRDNLLSAMSIENKAEIDLLIGKFKTGEVRNPQWSGGWSSTDVLELANLEGISASLGA